jgi:hypothetical protein
VLVLKEGLHQEKFLYSGQTAYHASFEGKKKKTHFLEYDSPGAIKCNCLSVTFDGENFSQDLVRHYGEVVCHKGITTCSEKERRAMRTDNRIYFSLDIDNTVGSYSTRAPEENDVSMSDLRGWHRLYIDDLTVADGWIHATAVRLETNTLAVL